MTEARTLGFADAGVELNLPYVPLLRRSVDVIIALDSSADSHDVWFTRAAEYAKTYENEAGQGQGGGIAATVGGGGAARGSRWPAVDVKALFPDADTGAGGAGTVQIKENEKDRNRAAARVDQAKQQESEAGLSGGGAAGRAQDEERGGVRLKNPKPTPLGSAPESKEMAAREEDLLDQSDKKAATASGEEATTSPASSSGNGDTTKPMPESQTKEPPLGKCSIWIGSTQAEDAARCRNDHPTVEDVVRRNGIALAYIPLSPDDDFKNPLEVFSTWKFDYTEDETDRLIRLAKGERAALGFSIDLPWTFGEADRFLLHYRQLQRRRTTTQDSAQGSLAPQEAATLEGGGSGAAAGLNTSLQLAFRSREYIAQLILQEYIPCRTNTESSYHIFVSVPGSNTNGSEKVK